MLETLDEFRYMQAAAVRYPTSPLGNARPKALHCDAEVDRSRRVEDSRRELRTYVGPWPGLERIRRLGFDERGEIRTVDVILPTRQETEIRKRCVTQPPERQAVLLRRLGFNLPSRRNQTETS